MDSVILTSVPEKDKDQSVMLLRQGFSHEPTYRWCLCADEKPGYEERLALCMNADYDYHFQYGHIQGAYINNQLVGVAYVQPPDMAEIAATFPWVDILTRCGAETLQRVEAYMAQIANVKLASYYHKLSFIVVDERCRGQGVGTRLLAWVDQIAQTNTASLGIQLETSSLNNVKLYERNGYRVMQEKDFFGIHQYLLFKEKRQL